MPLNDFAPSGENGADGLRHILRAVRYLSLEAQTAGFPRLAGTLMEATLTCDGCPFQPAGCCGAPVPTGTCKQAAKKE